LTFNSALHLDLVPGADTTIDVARISFTFTNAGVGDQMPAAVAATGSGPHLNGNPPTATSAELERTVLRCVAMAVRGTATGAAVFEAP
jgi:hypothetical protein